MYTPWYFAPRYFTKRYFSGIGQIITVIDGINRSRISIYIGIRIGFILWMCTLFIGLKAIPQAS